MTKKNSNEAVEPSYMARVRTNSAKRFRAGSYEGVDEELRRQQTTTDILVDRRHSKPKESSTEHLQKVPEEKKGCKRKNIRRKIHWRRKQGRVYEW